MYIIGITGWTTSGKSSVVNVLRSLDPRWTIHKFAAPLKKAVLNFTGEAEETNANKARLRPLYQAYGTYMRTRHGDDYWVDLALAGAIFSRDQFVLFDDLRYPNEAEALLALDEPTALIRLDISEATRDARYLHQYGTPLDPKIAGHISEHALDDYPHFTDRIDAERPFAAVMADVLRVLAEQHIPVANLRQHLAYLERTTA